MIQDSILVCSPDPRIPHTARAKKSQSSDSVASDESINVMEPGMEHPLCNTTYCKKD
jgi:hypothetical protein